MKDLREAAWFGIFLVLTTAQPRTAPSQHAAGSTGARPVVRFLLGSLGGFNQREFLREYAKSLRSIDLIPVESTRSGPTRLEELQRGEADLAINTSQAAYLAYSGQQEDSTER